MAEQSKIRLLIVDDHEIVRSGLIRMLRNTEIDVVGEAASGQAALKFVSENAVDVVLMDVRMPDGDGLTALGRIRLDKPDMPILIFSYFDNPAHVGRAVAMGANGFLLKNCTRDVLVQGIKTVATGATLWTSDELRRVTGALATPRPIADIEVTLTQRELEVLRQLTAGLTNNQIAEALDIGYETVKEHVQHILGKVGVTSRTQAALWAVHKKLV
jgi:DNA-binding NarL/FixJ family response regulator